MPYTNNGAIYTKVLGDILQLRVTETIREAEGGAYSPRASANFFREPKSFVFISFRFDCNPDMADRLVNIVNTELRKLANDDLTDDDLNKIKTNLLKERQQATNSNAYDMQLLMSLERYNENLNDPKNFEDVVNKMTKKDIQNIAKQVSEGGKSYRIVFKPS
ncbi:insulinase family protein [Pedobacter agri]|uniref:insulinase family protein n=1 Tax=Pedobacter agri TaxID=454586 RepID=UPI00292F4878|nr:insulinase family protein [Pedobacter agri]